MNEQPNLDVAQGPLDEKARQLAAAHWRYVESVLRTHEEREDVITKCGYHYRTAFAHGWKHAHEERKAAEMAAQAAKRNLLIGNA